MKDPTVQAMLSRLRKVHDPDSNRIMDFLETIVSERDALAYKLEDARKHIECLECIIADRQIECPVYTQYKAKKLGGTDGI